MRFCVLAALALAVPTAALAECREDQVDIRGDFGSARFTVEIADDVEERAEGLMFRESLGASRGMLFLYEVAGAPAFWMKNTLIPLDMLFVDPDGLIRHVHSEAQPGDLTGISGGTGIIAVLEIRGGMAEAIGIDAGDEMRHPFFDGENAVWSCNTQ